MLKVRDGTIINVTQNRSVVEKTSSDSSKMATRSRSAQDT